VNRSGAPVDIYWLDYSGNRRLGVERLPVGATHSGATFLTYPFLVVASDTGGTTVHDTGVRLAAFQAVTPNPERDPAIRDTAVITNPSGSARANPAPDGAQPRPMGFDRLDRGASGVSAPFPLTKVDPEYTNVARALAIAGTVTLMIVVDQSGTARDINVVKSLGYGLDEKAIEAVRKWRFRPGMKDGKPVNVRATIYVNFRLVGRRPDFWYFSGPIDFETESGVAPPIARDVTMPTKPAGDSSNEVVILRFTVDSRGSVTDIHPLSGTESASQLLARDLAAWKFQPAMNGNQSVEVSGTVRFVKGVGDQR
jgi:TonB family protein